MENHRATAVGKMVQNKHWKSLSIPKGQSASYNKEMFSKEKSRVHFTKELIPKSEE